MDKKLAVVTGSRRGIGRAIAEKLARAGYRVILSGTAAQDPALEKHFTESGLDAVYFPCDVSSSEDRSALVSFAKSFGRLDLWVNNAGVAPLKRLDILETPEESFDRVLGINLKGTFFLCQMVARAMLDFLEVSPDGYYPRIINIGSMSAYTSSTSRGEYCISKAGVSMVTALFADRLAEFGIPVFEVRPGIIQTDMTAAVTEKYEKLISEGITPIRRFGLPNDVADCVLAAASGLLDFATGQILNADGGFHIRRL